MEAIMPEPSDKKLIKGIRKAVSENGYVSVRMECGSDQTGVSFGNWETAPLWTPEKRRLKEELVRKLSLPNASETSVDGTGEINIQDGQIQLLYSLTDVDYGHLSIEQEQLPIPDAKNVRIVTPDDFPAVDFEVTISVLGYRNPESWHADKSFQTAPAISIQQRQQVVSFLEPMISPLFENLKKERMEFKPGDIRVNSIYLKGFCWHSTNEMYYELELGRELVRNIVKNETMALFE